jgi:ubiquinone biosynthesis protein UbiJ
MLHTLTSALAAPVLERATLVVNHVLGAEPAATERLRPHSGKAIEVRLQGLPSLIPPPPRLAFRITPAGLLEWCGEQRDLACELQLAIDASNPALLVLRTASGTAPQATIEGDAQLAAEVGWLMQNLRWDAGADLERVLPAPVAQTLVQLGSTLAGALRSALAMAERARWRQ